MRITRPIDHEKSFVNRKNYHSINVQVGNILINFLLICSNFIVSLQVICDANCCFLSVNATKPGSCNGSTIFKSSTIGLKFARGQFGNGFLLGDSGYACATYLLTPYGNPSTVQEVDLITFIYILCY